MIVLVKTQIKGHKHKLKNNTGVASIIKGQGGQVWLGQKPADNWRRRRAQAGAAADVSIQLPTNIVVSIFNSPV